MRSNYNEINPARLRQARFAIFYHYGHKLLVTMTILLGLFCLDILHGARVTSSVIGFFQQKIPILAVCLMVLAIGLTVVFYYWDTIVMSFKARKRVARFKKNLSMIVRSEYGYVTDDNLPAIRKVASTMYSASTGTPMAYNQLSYKGTDFFNVMLLKKDEQLALYGKTLGFGRRSMIVL